MVMAKNSINMTDRKVTLVDYDDSWPTAYRNEVMLIRDILAELLLQAHHIGSTAIPGMKAKPIIDILLVVSDIRAVERHSNRFLEIGYESFGDNGINGRLFFRKAVIIVVIMCIYMSSALHTLIGIFCFVTICVEIAVRERNTSS